MRPAKIKPLDPARVALLKCRGVPQSVIAKTLRLGEATVSRLLSDKKGGGEASKYIKPLEFDWSRVSASERAALRALDDVEGLSPLLTEKLSSILRRLSTRLSATVILTKTGAGKGVQRSALPSDFYEGAVRAVWELLTPADVIGITWGRTLSKLLEAARKTRLPARYSGKKQPTIIPLCGESLGANWPSNLSSSALTQEFGEVLTTGSGNGYLALSMIPVFLPGPKAFPDDEVKAVKKLLQYSPAYAKIFGPGGRNERPLVDRLDIVITSISQEDRAFGVDDPDYTWKTLKLREFGDMVIGDLAGIPLPRPDTSPKTLNALQERWTGLQEDHLRACAQRASAADNAPAGVIVVGAGRERAACIIEAVRRGLVNHVVVDEDLGRTLIDRLK